MLSSSCGDESTLLLSNNKPKRCRIQQRYILSFMGCFAVVNAYMMRVALSVAITAMTLPLNGTQMAPEDTCRSSKINPNATLHATLQGTSPLYDWDEETQGLILSSFYWGYLITQLPGGVLAEKFGGKYTLGFGILSTAMLTLITPFVVKIGNWPWLIVLRILMGLGEGTTFPALNSLLAKWVPLSERAKLGTLVYSGAQIGNIAGNAVSGILIGTTNSWESVFYVFGGVGIVWFLFWIALCYSEPDRHPFISKEEKNYLTSELVCSIPNDEKDIPWRFVFTSVPLWALVIANFGYDWGLYTMITELPKYMKSVLKFDVEQSGMLSALPYLTMFGCSMGCAWLCDWVIKKQYMNITWARKCFASIASVVAGIFLLSASYSGCNRLTAIVLFSVGMGFMGAGYSGVKVNVLDLAPNYAGTIMGVVNGSGAIGGILAPSITGIIAQHQTLSEWRVIFWITFVIFIVTDFIFLLFGSGNEQWWNRLNNGGID